MKILLAGNKNFGLAAELYKLYPDAFFASRTTGFDLTKNDDQKKLAELILKSETLLLENS